jgi:predicted transcriptional regulator of viral defense system
VKQSLNAVADRIVKLLKQHRLKQADVVPNGWFTVDEVAKMLKVGRSQARRVAKLLKFPTRKFRIVCGAHLQPVTHYKP